VQPVQIPAHHESAEVTLTMTIDETGKPRNVEVASKSDQEAYKRLRATVAQWRFKPARKNGEVVPAKVVLPLQVTGL
jgi:TonB family protein